jgi:hypothetical protein
MTRHQQLIDDDGTSHPEDRIETNAMTQCNDRPNDRQDEGSVLTMVLVFIVISSLIVVPMLTYSVTVLRVNSVSVDKREDLEAVRAGARVSIADWADVFNTCDAEQPLPPVALDTPAVATTSVCRQLSYVGVTDQLAVPHGAVVMQVGEVISDQPFSGGTREPAAASAPDWWQADGYATDPVAGTIWLPNLPEPQPIAQDAGGHLMPSPYACRVYFPGVYDAPITIDEAAYFASGVYYFEENVTVLGGGDVVAGFGLAEGCVDDLQSTLDISPSARPTFFNLSGLGATLIFGGDARLIVDDTKTLDLAGNVVDNTADLAANFSVNQRYVENAADGGARVSIMSVNGDTDVVDPLASPITTTVGDLFVPGSLVVPESMVITGETTPLVRASASGLVPSVHTAEQRVPSAPNNVAVVARRTPSGQFADEGAAAVSWDAPVGNDSGGTTITGYTVTATASGHPTRTCATDGALECIVTDLEEDVEYSVTVVASNVVGDSPDSAAVDVEPVNSSPRIRKPTAPTAVAAVPALAPDTAVISWTAAPNDSRAPIAYYEARTYAVYEGLTGPARDEIVGATCRSMAFRDQPAAESCLISGLPELAAPGRELTPAPLAVYGAWLGYEFEVVAVNAATNLGQPAAATTSVFLASDASAPSASPRHLEFDGSGSAVPPPPPVAPIAPVFVPEPIVDINLSGGAVSIIDIAGYVAIPQGRLEVISPSGNTVRIVGGVVAGTYAIDASTLGTETTVGFEDTVLQRTIEITTTLPGSNRLSRMTVQVNANGAEWAVNSWVTQ